MKNLDKKWWKKNVYVNKKKPKKQYAVKEGDLYNLINEKKKIDSQITVEGLQNALKKHTDVK